MVSNANFMEKLSRQTSHPQNRTFNVQTRKIERLSLNNPTLLGRYQILPYVSVTTDFPYVSGYVRQINMPRKSVDASGQETSYNTWIHIPDAGFYQMKDGDRIVSSLTADDEKILVTAQSIWDELAKELDLKTNFMKYNKSIRARNFTLFTGYCINFWKFDSTNARTPDRQNFNALYMVTSKGFINNVDENIKGRVAMEGGDESWIDKVYNNQLSGRDGFMMFSINMKKGTPGFITSVQHEYGRSQMLSSYELPAEDVELGLFDPFYLFLGWQASNQDKDKPLGQRRLFNAKLIKEASDYLGTLLASVRATKVAGGSIEEAIARTNEETLQKPATTTETQGTPNQGQPSMGMGQQQPQGNTWGGSAQIDPVSSTPTGGFGGFGGGGFTTPDFSKPGAGFDPGNTPF